MLRLPIRLPDWGFGRNKEIMMQLKLLRLVQLRIILCAVVSACLLAITGSVAFAHPAPSVLHDYVISLTPQLLKVESYLRISPELVPEVYRQVDTDGNGKTSAVELEAWYEAHASKLQVALDDVDVPVTPSKLTSLSNEDLLVSLSQPVIITYTFTPEKALSGKHRVRLTYGDNYLDYDEYYISVRGDVVNDGQPVGVSRPMYPATYQVIYQMPDASEGQNQGLSAGVLAPAPWTAVESQPQTTTGANSSQTDPGGSVSQVAQPPSDTDVNSSSGPIAPLLDTLRNWQGEIWTALGMLALAVVVGALHALTPGHGKAMVAAYLIGSRGRVRDAVLLGGVVTITHTVGVMILGLVLLLVSNFTVPRALTPALELVSGLLVLVLGIYLLIRRWNETRAASGESQAHLASDMPEAKTHLQGSLGSGGVSTLALASATSSLPVRPVAGDPYSSHTFSRSVEDRTYQAHGHSHEDGIHGHSHSHGHSHGHVHSVKPEGLRSLVSLGVSGGLVPCPDALAILLLAASVSQFALGLGLVVAFSLGLAGVLIAIGVALVKMKGIMERTNNLHLVTNPVWTRWVPILSAAVVVSIGALILFSALGSPWS